MSTTGLYRIISRAVVSPAFQTGLLTDNRPELFHQFDLTPGELAALLAIRANSFKEFAANVQEIIQVEDRGPREHER